MARFLALPLAFVFALAAGPVSAASIAETSAAIHALHARLAAKKRQLEFEETRSADLAHQLSQTQSEMATVSERVRQLDAADARTVAAMRASRLAFDAATLRLAAQRAAMRRRVVAMYEEPNGSTLSVMLGVHSFSDLVERWDELRYIAVADRQAIRDREAAEEAVAVQLRALTAEANRLEAERTARTQARDQLSALADERRRLAEIADSDRASVAGEVKTLEDLTAQEEAQLEAILRAREAAAAATRAQQSEPAPAPPSTGAMAWPLRGPITSPFGMRLNPFTHANTEFHPGIDIGVPVGTTIVSAAAGKVIVVGWVSGYGNYIAIDHGGGISTGYGHLSSFYVAVGQDVQRGQAIGASGNTGRSTGPHLIFEVRRDGNPVDPNPFLGP